MDQFVQLAKDAVGEYVINKKTLETPDYLSNELLINRAGIFVSIHQKPLSDQTEGESRGCIGTIEPLRENIAQEIIHNAISACQEDPRFYPVQAQELSNLQISVDELKPAELLSQQLITQENLPLDKLDVKKYGVIVKSGCKTGLLLPDIKGVDSEQEQVQIACQKATILNNQPFYLYRFAIIRHQEN